MRKALRVAALTVLAYLVQATVLPYFKISGVMLDLVSITLFSIGFSAGYYPGLMAGLLEAWLMEAVSGDLPGLTAAICVLAPLFGAYIAVKIENIHITNIETRSLSIEGRPVQARYVEVSKWRNFKRAMKRFGPMIAVGGYVLAKEAVYATYFSLTGVDLQFIHYFRVFIAGIYAMIFSLALVPLIYRFLQEKQKKARQEVFEPPSVKLSREAEAMRGRREEEEKKPRIIGEDDIPPMPADISPKGGMDG